MKQLKVTVNGKVYDIVIEEVGSSSAPKAAAPVSAPVAAPAPAAAPAAVAAAAPAPKAASSGPAGAGSIVAPMSGTVTKHKVKVGDVVKRGDVIVILEAMKMENDLIAPLDGTVREIRVNEGSTVQPGEVIIVID